jgi:glycosyltransferase involved in cell wall biosynthesis
MFIAVSDFIKKKLIEKGFPENKVVTHYLGTDMGVVPVEPRREKIVLTIGRLVEKKGTKYLVKACAELAKNMPDIRLVICGDGPMKDELATLALDLGFQDKIEFVGWRSKAEVQNLIRKARVFALPSITAEDGDAEGLGMVLIEAMALGIPCVGTVSGGIPDAVADNETGFLAAEKNHIDLAEKIKLLLSDHSLSIEMGKKGRKRAEEIFDIKKQVAGLEKIYGDFI